MDYKKRPGPLQTLAVPPSLKIFLIFIFFGLTTSRRLD